MAGYGTHNVFLTLNSLCTYLERPGPVASGQRLSQWIVSLGVFPKKKKKKNRSLNKVYGVISISNIFLIVVIKRGVCFMRSNKKVINTSKADSDVFPVNQKKHK